SVAEFGDLSAFAEQYLFGSRIPPADFDGVYRRWLATRGEDGPCTARELIVNDDGPHRRRAGRGGRLAGLSGAPGDPAAPPDHGGGARAGSARRTGRLRDHPLVRSASDRLRPVRTRS